MVSQDQFMDTAAAANYLAVTEIHLAQRRCNKLGPPYLKVGRLVRYRKSDLDRWVEQNLHNVDAA